MSRKRTATAPERSSNTLDRPLHLPASLPYRFGAFATLATLLGTIGTAVAQQPDGQPHPSEKTALRQELPAEVQDVIGLAYMAPPEFGADALIRLLKAGLIPDREKKLELLRDAFQMALQAPDPVKYSYPRGAPFDTRQGLRWRRFNLDVDGESLRCRAVQALLPIDKRLAREWFEEMGLPRPPKHECRSTLVYDPEIFFQTLRRLMDEAFSPEEREKHEHVIFAERYLKALTSPPQVLAAAGLLATAELDREGFARLLDAFCGSLERMPADARAFRDGWGLMEAVRPVAEKCRKWGLSFDRLVGSLRGYIVRNMRAVRCADSFERRARAPRYPKSIGRHLWPAVDEKFNAWSARRPPYVAEEIPPLSEEETEPEGVGPAPDNRKYWTGPTASRLLDDYRRLRFKPHEPGEKKPKTYSVEERQRHQWRSRFFEYLEQLESWKGDDEPEEVDYLLQKLNLYWALVEIVPPGEARDRLLGSCLSLIRQLLRRAGLRGVGMYYTNFLVEQLSRSRLTAAGEREEQHQDVDWALRALERSGSPLLTLFAKLDRLTNPRSRPRKE